MQDPRRQKIIAEALSWKGTPYHHAARVKGVGVDCLTFIAEVYERVGIVPHQEIPFYRPDFFRHSAEETYLEGLIRHGREVEYPLPADIALFKWGRVFGHAGIVIDWPNIIHCYGGHGVLPAKGNTGKLMGREVKFISAFEDQK